MNQSKTMQECAVGGRQIREDSTVVTEPGAVATGSYTQLKSGTLDEDAVLC
jgi:hypothetical protein